MLYRSLQYLCKAWPPAPISDKARRPPFHARKCTRVYPELERDPMEPDYSPIEKLEDVRTFVFTYIVIGPLLSALFAEHIDNRLAVALIFVIAVGAALTWTRNRMAELESSIRDREERIAALCREHQSESDVEAQE
jgi:hypothetical protein